MLLEITQPLRFFYRSATPFRARNESGVSKSVPGRQLNGLRVVITGGTDGIGLALARLLSARGSSVLIVGRRPETDVGPQLAAGQMYLRADLTEPETPQLVANCLTQIGWHSVDLLIHNAAAGWVGTAELQSVESVDTLLVTNLIAPCALSRILIPYLRPSRGSIVFIGSVVADTACPTFAVYGATKSALSGFARSLRQELLGAVEVQVIHPGPTRTGFHAKSGFHADARWRTRLLSRFFIDPQCVATGVLRAIQNGRAVSTVAHKAGFFEWIRTIGRLI